MAKHKVAAMGTTTTTTTTTTTLPGLPRGIPGGFPGGPGGFPGGIPHAEALKLGLDEDLDETAQEIKTILAGAGAHVFRPVPERLELPAPPPPSNVGSPDATGAFAKYCGGGEMPPPAETPVFASTPKKKTSSERREKSRAVGNKTQKGAQKGAQKGKKRRGDRGDLGHLTKFYQASRHAYFRKETEGARQRLEDATRASQVSEREASEAKIAAVKAVEQAKINEIARVQAQTACEQDTRSAEEAWQQLSGIDGDLITTMDSDTKTKSVDFAAPPPAL